MTLFSLLNKFRNDESGAVTVDWVVLTAAIVGLAIAIGSVMFDNVRTLANDIDTELTTYQEAGVNVTLTND
jgi:Flp pilus assembly pilin Flp